MVSLLRYILFTASFGFCFWGQAEVPQVKKGEGAPSPSPSVSGNVSGSVSVPSASPTPAPTLTAVPTVAPAPAPSVLPPPPPPVPTASVSPVSSPSAASSPKQKLRADQVGSLREEFLKAQQSERLALQHRHELELQELEVSQQAIRKGWEEKQKGDKQRVFQESLAPAQRLQYDQEIRKKRESLGKLMSQDRQLRNQEHQESLQKLNQTQKLNRDKFESSLKRLEYPPAELWPH